MADSTRKQKVEKIIQKYGVTEDEALYIITANEVDLTLDQLKIKYDNPDIGKLPEWLTEENLSNMIWKMIHKYKGESLLAYKNKEDVYQEVQLHIRKKSNKIKNYNYLKAIISNYLLCIMVETRKLQTYIPYQLDRPIYENESSKRYLKDYIAAPDTSPAEYEIISLIEGISDKSVKKFLIVTGYLVCDIKNLKNLYKDVINNSSKKVQDNLIALENKSKERPIKAKSVITALLPDLKNEYFLIGLNLDEPNLKITTKELFEEYRFYLKNNILLD